MAVPPAKATVSPVVAAARWKRGCDRGAVDQGPARASPENLVKGVPAKRTYLPTAIGRSSPLVRLRRPRAWWLTDGTGVVKAQSGPVVEAKAFRATTCQV